MISRSSKHLAPHVFEAISRIWQGLATNSVAQSDIDLAIEAFRRLPSRSVVTIEKLISSGRLLNVERGQLEFTAAMQSADRLKIITSRSGLAFVCLFHRNGYIREAALNVIDGPLPTPFFVAALLLRLNDWVPEVRLAAYRCAGRSLPQTDAQTLARAQIDLLPVMNRWQRWLDEADAADLAFSRSDVRLALAEALLSGRGGGMGTALRIIWRTPVLDGDLVRLATEARHADVRAPSLRALLTGAVFWRSGYEYKWEDKVYNIKRRVPVMARRLIADVPSPGALIKRSAADKSSRVRLVVADWLIDNCEAFRASITGLDDVVNRLALDSSSAVRERITYLRRVRMGQGP